MATVPEFILVFDDDPEIDGTVETDPAAETVVVTLTQGRRGPAGESAYELAVDDGYGGTLEQWIDFNRGNLILDDILDPIPVGTPDRTIVWVRV